MAIPSGQRRHARTRLRGLIEPMLARPVDDFPAGRPGSLCFEPQLGGFRALARVDDDRGVHLQSRRGARLNEVFPEVVWSVFEHILAGSVFDGEIVRWGPSGRLDFGALHRRNIAGRPPWRGPSRFTSRRSTCSVCAAGT
ncbi:hypothetical protein [Nonomuraea sp. NPDC050202]|uniref:hypothetical protein n=1 Tax=Nonomuraea sp. NPDC050202 TaxID=3155035 RepID=UPI0033F2DB92